MVLPSLTSSPVPVAKPAKKTWRRFFKRLGFSLLGLLAILLIVFLLLPQWISNEQGRTYVLEQLNKKMRAKVSIGEWTVGWFRSTELRDVSITAPDGTALLVTPKIRSELSLWSLLWGNYDIGTTTVESPRITLVKYPDGTTSVDALSSPDPRQAGGLDKTLRTLRGALQFSNGSLTLKSVRENQSITYDDVKATLTIASPDAPFHIQLAANSPDRNLSLTTSLQPIRNWTARNWPQALLASDIDANATNLPAGMVFDWGMLDQRWQDSTGERLDKIAVSNRADLLKVEVRGPTDEIFVDAAVAVRAPGYRSPAVLTLPLTTTHHAVASLHVSRPLANVLRRINPIFADLQPGSGLRGLVNIALGDLKVTTNDPLNAELMARVYLPGMTFDPTGLAARLLASDPQVPLAATAEPFRVRLSDGRFSYDNLTVTFARRQRVTFRGDVSLNGAVDLMATVPAHGDDAVGMITSDVPIVGTIDAPTIAVPR